MAQIELKPLDQQVVVVFGAASGIGRLSAQDLARGGAKVVVAARDKEALDSLVLEIEREGGEATAVVADASEFAQIEKVAKTAVETYGRIDTWVHTAAAAMYARFEETTPDEFKRVIDVTLTGAAWGALAALPHLKKQGGALVQISSIEAMVPIPYQAAYGAAKHGMKAYLDVLRMELEHDGIPVSVTNIMPSGINTPFFTNARTKLGVKPVAVPPMYEPQFVADAVLTAAQKPIAEIVVGGAGVMFALTQRISPSLNRWILKKTSFELQKTDEPKSENAPDNLFSPKGGEARVQGDFSDRARGSSIATWFETHPEARAVLGVAALGTALLMLKRR